MIFVYVLHLSKQNEPFTFTSSSFLRPIRQNLLFSPRVDPIGELADVSKLETCGRTRSDEALRGNHREEMGDGAARGSEECSEKMEVERRKVNANRFTVLLGMFVWLGGVHLTLFLLVASALTMSWRIFVTCFALLVSLLFVPLYDTDGWKKKFSTFIVKCALAYFPITLEQEEELDDDKRYIIAFFPHSALPVGISALHPSSPLCPKNFKNGKLVGCGSSAICWCPFVRHVWSWLSIESCSRPHVSKRLEEGMSVILIPGGVRECMLLQEDSENIFLSTRKGFIKLALQHGVSIVPAFAFGQSSAYHYARLGPPFLPRRAVDMIARAIGFLPMYIWGAHGSPLPRPVPIHVVLGKPIHIKQKVSNPTYAQLNEIHAVYVEELKALFHRHVGQVPDAKPTLVIH